MHWAMMWGLIGLSALVGWMIFNKIRYGLNWRGHLVGRFDITVGRVRFKRFCPHRGEKYYCETCGEVHRYQTDDERLHTEMYCAYAESLTAFRRRKYDEPFSTMKHAPSREDTPTEPTEIVN